MNIINVSADLQIDISGSEYWEWTDKAEFTDTFQEASDCGLAKQAEADVAERWGTESFALFSAGRISQTKPIKTDHTHEESSC